MPPVTVQRSISLRSVVAVLMLGTALTGLSDALAQEIGEMRLRGLANVRSPTALPTLAPHDASALNVEAGTGAQRVGLPLRSSARLRTRRARSPVVGEVRARRVRAAVISPNLAREVQPMVVGLPDPPPPPLRRRRRPAEEDPYAQLGLRLGGITVLPALQESVGYDSNPNRASAGRKGSFVSRTEGEVVLRSDWPTHALTGFLRGSYSAYPEVRGADRPEGEGRIALRLDATRDTQLDIEGHGRLDTERPGSPELGVAVRERPLVAVAGTSLGVTQRFNRLLVGLRGTVDRTLYEDATLPDGSILDQSDRNNTQYGVRARIGYEVTPGLIPFVEGLADRRVHDNRIDRAGFRRDSDGVGARAGSTFEITRTLTGEAAVGVQQRTYDDPVLKDLRGPLVDAAIVWSASPLTTIRLRAQSRVDETNIANASGILVQSAGLEVQHDLRRNLSVTAGLTLSESDYKGVSLREETLTGTIRADYKLTRSVVLRASFTHERLKSTAPGSDYSADVFLLGLRFQP